MARTKTPKHKADNILQDPTVCLICGTKVARKGDMSRHMRYHLSVEEKAAKSYCCPYPGCGYSNLQKGNVDTHIRTHTKIKNQQCPSCEFATVDPGSLTRHRKRRHEYVPKQRKARTPGNISSQQEQMIETPSTSSSEGSEIVEVPSSASSAFNAHAAGYDSDATQSVTTSVYTVLTPSLTMPAGIDPYTNGRPSPCSSKIRGPLDLLAALSAKNEEEYWQCDLHSPKAKSLLPGYQSTPPLESDDMEVFDAGSVEAVCGVFWPSDTSNLDAEYTSPTRANTPLLAISDVPLIEEHQSAYLDAPVSQPEGPSTATSETLEPNL